MCLAPLLLLLLFLRLCSVSFFAFVFLISFLDKRPESLWLSMRSSRRQFRLNERQHTGHSCFCVCLASLNCCNPQSTYPFKWNLLFLFSVSWVWAHSVRFLVLRNLEQSPTPIVNKVHDFNVNSHSAPQLNCEQMYRDARERYTHLDDDDHSSALMSANAKTKI